MYHHTVLLQFGPGFDGAAQAAFEALARDVIGAVQGVLAYRLTANEAPSRGPYRHVLFSAFVDRAAFDGYDRSELHGRIKAVLAPYLVSLVVGDGEVPHG